MNKTQLQFELKNYAYYDIKGTVSIDDKIVPGSLFTKEVPLLPSALREYVIIYGDYSRMEIPEKYIYEKTSFSGIKTKKFMYNEIRFYDIPFWYENGEFRYTEEFMEIFFLK